MWWICTTLGCCKRATASASARKRAADAGVTDRVSFETASAQTFSGDGYDLVTTFDCLHDMGDPAAAARHIRQALAADGSWLIVEPMAGDTVQDNLNPVGRVYYGFSTLLCLPNALRGALTAARAGAGPVIVVTGEGGAGKTTLVEHVLAGAGTPVLRGRAACHSALSALGAKPRPRGAARRAAAGLTGRELEIMLLVAQGNTSRQIGEALFISPRTVEMHVQGSLLKLQCRTRADAVRRLAELGTLEPPRQAGQRASRN